MLPGAWPWRQNFPGQHRLLALAKKEPDNPIVFSWLDCFDGGSNLGFGHVTLVHFEYRASGIELPAAAIQACTRNRWRTRSSLGTRIR